MSKEAWRALALVASLALALVVISEVAPVVVSCLIRQAQDARAAIIPTCKVVDDNCVLQGAAIHEYAWQGRWAMIGCGISAATLAALVFGFVQTAAIYRNTNRGFLKGRIESVSITEGGKIDFKARIQNYGKTEAMLISAVVSWAITPNEGPIHSPPGRRGEVHAFSDHIHPEDSVWLELFRPIQWDEAELAPWLGKSGEVVFIVAGSYRDAFGNTHPFSFKKTCKLTANAIFGRVFLFCD